MCSWLPWKIRKPETQSPGLFQNLCFNSWTNSASISQNVRLLIKPVTPRDNRSFFKFYFVWKFPTFWLWRVIVGNCLQSIMCWRGHQFKKVGVVRKKNDSRKATLWDVMMPQFFVLDARVSLLDGTSHPSSLSLVSKILSPSVSLGWVTSVHWL